LAEQWLTTWQGSYPFNERLSKDIMMKTNYSPAITPAAVIYKTEVIDGLKIAYREAGDAAKPKMVLLHGFPSSSHQCRNLIAALADRFHVIAPDYPGFGDSDTGHFAVEDCLDYI
jgi:hypothetical protein